MTLDLPTGILTFLFTDIEGSTHLLQDLGSGYAAVQDNHALLMRQAISEAGGTEVRTVGDAFFAVFSSALDAMRAATSAQRAFATSPWPHGEPLLVRMGMHTGQGTLGGDDYIGIDVNRAARIAAVGYGGQVLVSDATRGLVEQDLPEGLRLRDLGTHRLKDLARPMRIWQVDIEGLPTEFPALRTTDARPTNLIPERTSFVGRAREKAMVADLMEAHRLVTLTGPGGTGKTRLALAVAAQRIDAFPDGVFMVDLSAITEPALIPSAIASATGAREEPARPVLDTLADQLRTRTTLLVIDNFEQVTDGASVVERLLDEAPGLTVLVTSRVPLHLYGEQEFSVPPLGLPDGTGSAGPESIEGFEAVALFVERVRAVLPEFRITDENATEVAEIIAHLDGLPLAIELAAGRAKILSPEAMRDRLRLQLLAGGARDLPERHRTLRATIGWSHDLLDEPERRLFARLGAFAGGCTLGAAEEVCGQGLDMDVLDGLASLVDNSLLRRTEGPEPRFSMLETIREYAVERLADSGEEAEIRGLHVGMFLALAGEAEPLFLGVSSADWLDRFEVELDNVRGALAWTVATDDASTGLRLATALRQFWQRRGHLTEGQTWIERLLAMSSADVDDALRARSLGALGRIAYRKNDDWAVVRSAHQEAAVIAERLGDPMLLAAASLDLSYVALLDDDYQRGRELLGESLTLANALADQHLIAEVTAGLSFHEFFSGSPEKGIPLLQKAIAMQRDLGEELLAAGNLIGLANANVKVGDVESASMHARDAIQTLFAARDDLAAGGALMVLALIENEQGGHERAARLIGSASRIRDESGGGFPQNMAERVGDPEADARLHLGDEAYERAWAEGYEMDRESLMAYALQ